MSFLLRPAARVGATLVSSVVRTAAAASVLGVLGVLVETSADADDVAGDVGLDALEVEALLAVEDATGAGALPTSPSLTPARGASATQATMAAVVSAAPTRGRRTNDMAALSE
jgi:hypothetical protein